METVLKAVTVEKKDQNRAVLGFDIYQDGQLTGRIYRLVDVATLPDVESAKANVIAELGKFLDRSEKTPDPPKDLAYMTGFEAVTTDGENVDVRETPKAPEPAPDPAVAAVAEDLKP